MVSLRKRADVQKPNKDNKQNKKNKRRKYLFYKYKRKEGNETASQIKETMRKSNIKK